MLGKKGNVSQNEIKEEFEMEDKNKKVKAEPTKSGVSSKSITNQVNTVSDNSRVKIEHKNSKNQSEITKEENIPQFIIKPQDNISYEGKVKAVMDAIKPILLPSSATWFDYNRVHVIEKESLSEFFNLVSNRTEKSYLILRNQIIDLFYENSNKYLTAYKCIKLIVI